MHPKHIVEFVIEYYLPASKDEWDKLAGPLYRRLSKKDTTNYAFRRHWDRTLKDSTAKWVVRLREIIALKKNGLPYTNPFTKIRYNYDDSDEGAADVEDDDDAANVEEEDDDDDAANANVEDDNNGNDDYNNDNDEGVERIMELEETNRNIPDDEDDEDDNDGEEGNKEVTASQVGGEDYDLMAEISEVATVTLEALKISSEHVGPAAPPHTPPSQTVESDQPCAPSKPQLTALSYILDPTNKQTSSPKKVPEKQLSPMQTYVMSDREDSDSDSESDEEYEPQRPKKSVSTISLPSK
jgi:hypothetical protein